MRALLGTFVLIFLMTFAFAAVSSSTETTFYINEDAEMSESVPSDADSRDTNFPWVAVLVVVLIAVVVYFLSRKKGTSKKVASSKKKKSRPAKKKKKK